ncbi:MAG: 3-phosphoshikimate 1-carboxyvinyltransferase [Lachnospiraceae bacterium]|nr:3-phosphoshikimate 1-carboxyvinyltransferase [Lachnospiraceae bacterium]
MTTDTYTVPCIADKIQHDKPDFPVFVSVPGSKSITNRAMLIAALANGESTLKGALLSGDSRVFIECMRRLGIDISETAIPDNTGDQDGYAEVDLTGNVDLKVKGCAGRLPASADLNVGSAGTAARFLTAALGVSHGTYHIDSSDQMRKRPMEPLLNALTELGCDIEFDAETGHFPFTLSSVGFGKDRINIDISDSSQFLSALLISSVLSDHDIRIDVTGSHGMSYVEMTCAMMSGFGVSVYAPGHFYSIRSGQKYTGRTFDIEPDASAAAYFYAMAPVLGIEIGVKGIHRDSIQGDLQFVRALIDMGCTGTETEKGMLVGPPPDGVIHGIDIDMSAFSDQAITLACVAVFADSPTTIRGVGHIRKQESDRLSGIATELGRMGIHTDMTDDSITIYPSEPQPATIRTYDDHRMAMGFTLIGLRSPGIVIDNPGCCSKTFENYYTVLENLIKELLNS